MEIIPHLWIADFENYDDKTFLKEKKITTIINLSLNLLLFNITIIKFI